MKSNEALDKINYASGYESMGYAVQPVNNMNPPKCNGGKKMKDADMENIFLSIHPFI